MIRSISLISPAMDVWALYLHGGGVLGGGAGKNQDEAFAAAALWHSSSWRRRRRISMPLLRPPSSRLVVRATGKKKSGDNPSPSGDNNPLIPEEDGSDGVNQSTDKSKLDSTNKSHSLLDWRDFRANLVAREQGHLPDSDGSSQDSTVNEGTQRLGLKWAHPITVPESGCVLVATEKLDGVPNFERTVVFLLRLGTRDPREGPFGVIVNRPLHKKIKQMKLSNPDVATTFGDCPLHYGGPLDSNMFLLKNRKNSRFPSFEQIVPGISFGAKNNLEEAAELVTKGALGPHDFTFFVGYAGWQLDQLMEEIESGYWVVAACSSHLIGGAAAVTSPDLWGEILQLMGGEYSDMSKKPKQDGS